MLTILLSKMASKITESQEVEGKEEKSFHPTKTMRVRTNLIRYKNRTTEYLTIPSSVTTQTQWMFNQKGAGKTEVDLLVDFMNRKITVEEVV